ncbi:MAG: ABC transporter ATP-binding protein [Saprospirales bacterium]|nr:MAG: ABC transporter ATP-binding protein [Saprospirales bacterium]
MIKIRNLIIRSEGSDSTPLLDISDLSIEKGKILFLIGKSGSGKSLTLSALAGWQKQGLAYSGGVNISLKHNGAADNYSMLDLAESALSNFRKQHLGYIMQQPYAALNPTMKLGKQLLEKRVSVGKLSLNTTQVQEEVMQLMQNLQLEEPDRMMQSYPFQLSGGQLQRMAIAMALQNQPELILADEPTSALDASTRKKVLELLIESCRSRNITLIISSHELDSVRKFADELICLKDGKIVYRGSAETSAINDNYTQSFFSAFDHYSKVSKKTERSKKSPDEEGSEIKINDLGYSYKSQNLLRGEPENTIFNRLNISFRKNCRVGILGKSGSGKTTLARLLSGLVSPKNGSLFFNDKEFKKGIREKDYPKIQMIFQDPYSSFNPIRTISVQLQEVASIKYKKPGQITELIRQFGLEESMTRRKPNQLSGGQLQRFAIIRVLISEPDGLIMDEFVTGLDIHWKIKIIEEVKKYLLSRSLNIWVISHEEQLLRHLCDELFQLKNGQLELII